MEIDAVDKAVSADPFEPFRLHLATGDVIDVLFDDSVFIHGKQLLIIERTGDGRRAIRSYRFVDPRLLDRIEAISGAAAQPLTFRLPDISGVRAPVRRAVDWLESILALTASALIAFLVALLGLGTFVYLGSSKSTPITDMALLGGWAVLLLFEIFLLLRLSWFFGRRLYPLPLLYALAKEPPRFTFSRLAMGLIWLGHGFIGVIAFIWLEQIIRFTYEDQRTTFSLFAIIFGLIAVCAGAHASMMFFLLAARSIGATPQGVRRLWRLRLGVDLTVALIALLSAPWLLQLVLLIGRNVPQEMIPTQHHARPYYR
jgi:hypothetical protein